MKIIEGNLLDINKGVIIHQVNNRGVMGAGIAKQIRAKYPKHYDDYMKNKQYEKLGDLVYTRIRRDFVVIGMISQDGYGRDKDKVYTSYDAFEQCLMKINKLYRKNSNVKYYVPFGIGCNLANGDWGI